MIPLPPRRVSCVSYMWLLRFLLCVCVFSVFVCFSACNRARACVKVCMLYCFPGPAK